MLKDMRPNGEIVFEARIDYQQPTDLNSSCTRVTIEATKLNFNAVIAASVRSLSGNVRVVIKPPPSDRIWWCFTEQPKMDIDIEPVVGPRAIKWGTLLSFIQKKMREGMAEAIIAPNMDDVPFFHTDGLDVRGGVFNVASRASARHDFGDEEELESYSDGEVENDNENDVTSGLRYRSSKTPARQNTVAPNIADDWAEQHAVQRSETSPDLGTHGIKAKVRSTKNQPSSLSKSVTASRQSSTSTEGSNFVIDKADKPPSSLYSPTDRSDAISSSTASVHSVSPPSPVSFTNSEVSARDRSVSSVSGSLESDPHKLTSAAILNAVRARDTATIEAQVSVAKQNVKKWGVNLMKKRNKRGGHDDGSELSSLHSTAPPATSVAEIHAPTPRHDGRSLQERLNAAAAQARDHRRTPSSASTLSKSFEKEPSPLISSSPPSRNVSSAVPSRDDTASSSTDVHSISSSAHSISSSPALAVAEGQETPSSDVKSVASSASVKTLPTLAASETESTQPKAPSSPDLHRIQRHDSDPLDATSHHSTLGSEPQSEKPSSEKPSSGSHDLAHMFKSAGDSLGETE